MKLYSYTYMMSRGFCALSTLFFSLAIVSCSSGGGDDEGDDSGSPDTSVHSSFVEASEVVDFSPAPGQMFEGGFYPSGITSKEDSKSIALASLQAKSLISLGCWGGSITVTFDFDVVNGDGYDIAVMGNTFGTSSEPGIVWVSKDNITWYELAGSESANTERGVSRTYSQAYCDEYNKTVTKPLYYSDWMGDSYTVTGSKLPSNVSEYSEGYYTMTSFSWGYADNYSSTDLVSSYNLFDIDQAIDSIGNSVELTTIRYVKVQSGVDADAYTLGEVSTEVSHIKARRE